MSPTPSPTPALVAVAHGSRDGRSAATVTELIGLVRAQRPEVDVRLAFLDFNAPRLPDVLAAVAGDGYREAVVVPLLLGAAYHARVDVPAAVHTAAGRLPRLEVRVADVLGPDPRLSAVALRRLVAAGATPGQPGLGVVLAAAGSSNRAANAGVHRVAASWPRTVAAFAAACEPGVGAAVEQLLAAGARRVAVASWFLAPGRLLDRVADAAQRAQHGAQVAGPMGADPMGAHPMGVDPTAADPIVAGPMGADPAVAQLVLDRYAAAAFGMSRRWTGGSPARTPARIPSRLPSRLPSRYPPASPAKYQPA